MVYVLDKNFVWFLTESNIDKSITIARRKLRKSCLNMSIANIIALLLVAMIMEKFDRAKIFSRAQLVHESRLIATSLD